MEDELLAALDERPGDEATRAVYADWLEQHGFAARAAFVRGDEQAGEDSDAAWRAVTSCAPLRCERDGCLGTWDQLAPTGTPRIRACNVCERCPVYCVSESEARAAGRQVHPVALDVVGRELMGRTFDAAEMQPVFVKRGVNPPAPRRRVVPLPDPQPLETARGLLDD